MEEQTSEENKNTLSRRKFLEIATLSIGGAIGLGIGFPAVSYVIGPSLNKSAVQEWIRVGSASKVEIGVPTLFKVKIERQVGWNITEEEIAVYILTEDGNEFLALSNICTHLGCRIRWIADSDQFFCPCHNAIFDKAGKVVAGPPPRPLDQFQVKLEDDQLYILGG